MGDGRHDEHERDLLSWERQDSEPPRAFRTLEIYRQMPHPRSLRKAHALATGEDPGRATSVPGGLLRTAKKWRWAERCAAWDKHLADEEDALIRRKRLEARARRLAAIDRGSSLLGKRLETMNEKDVKKMPAHRVIQELVRLHEDERLELRDRPEDRDARRGEDEGPLPAIEDIIKPPEET